MMGAVGRLIFVMGLLLAWPTIYAFVVQISNEMITAVFPLSGPELQQLVTTITTGLKSALIGVGGLLAQALATTVGLVVGAFLGGPAGAFVGLAIGAFIGFIGFLVFSAFLVWIIVQVVHLVVLKAVQVALLLTQFVFAPFFLIFMLIPDTEQITVNFVRSFVETSLWGFIWIVMLRIFAITISTDMNGWIKFAIAIGLLELMVRVPEFLAHARISPSSHILDGAKLANSLQMTASQFSNLALGLVKGGQMWGDQVANVGFGAGQHGQLKAATVSSNNNNKNLNGLNGNPNNPSGTPGPNSPVNPSNPTGTQGPNAQVNPNNPNNPNGTQGPNGSFTGAPGGGTNPGSTQGVPVTPPPAKPPGSGTSNGQNGVTKQPSTLIPQNNLPEFKPGMVGVSMDASGLAGVGGGTNKNGSSSGSNTGFSAVGDAEQSSPGFTTPDAAFGVASIANPLGLGGNGLSSGTTVPNAANGLANTPFGSNVMGFSGIPGLPVRKRPADSSGLSGAPASNHGQNTPNLVTNPIQPGAGAGVVPVSNGTEGIANPSTLIPGAFSNSVGSAAQGMPAGKPNSKLVVPGAAAPISQPNSLSQLNLQGTGLGVAPANIFGHGPNSQAGGAIEDLALFGTGANINSRASVSAQQLSGTNFSGTNPSGNVASDNQIDFTVISDGIASAVSASPWSINSLPPTSGGISYSGGSLIPNVVRSNSNSARLANSIGIMPPKVTLNSVNGPNGSNLGFARAHMAGFGQTDPTTVGRMWTEQLFNPSNSPEPIDYSNPVASAPSSASAAGYLNNMFGNAQQFIGSSFMGTNSSSWANPSVFGSVVSAANFDQSHASGGSANFSGGGNSSASGGTVPGGPASSSGGSANFSGGGNSSGGGGSIPGGGGSSGDGGANFGGGGNSSGGGGNSSGGGGSSGGWGGSSGGGGANFGGRGNSSGGGSSTGAASHKAGKFWYQFQPAFRNFAASARAADKVRFVSSQGQEAFTQFDTKDGSVVLGYSDNMSAHETAEQIATAAATRLLFTDPGGYDSARKAAVSSGALQPVGFKEKMAAMFLATRGQSFAETNLAKHRMNQAVVTAAHDGARAWYAGEQGNQFTEYLSSRYQPVNEDMRDELAGYISDDTRPDSPFNHSYSKNNTDVFASGTTFDAFATKRALNATPYLKGMHPSRKQVAFEANSAYLMAKAESVGVPMDQRDTYASSQASSVPTSVLRTNHAVGAELGYDNCQNWQVIDTVASMSNPAWKEDDYSNCYRAVAQGAEHVREQYLNGGHGQGSNFVSAVNSSSPEAVAGLVVGNLIDNYKVNPSQLRDNQFLQTAMESYAHDSSSLRYVANAASTMGASYVTTQDVFTMQNLVDTDPRWERNMSPADIYTAQAVMQTYQEAERANPGVYEKPHLTNSYIKSVREDPRVIPRPPGRNGSSSYSYTSVPKDLLKPITPPQPPPKPPAATRP